MHLDSSWTRTGIMLGAIVVAGVGNYAMLNSDVQRQGKYIEALQANDREFDKKIQRLTIDVAVTKTIVQRIERKLDNVIDKGDK